MDRNTFLEIGMFEDTYLHHETVIEGNYSQPPLACTAIFGGAGSSVIVGAH